MAVKNYKATVVANEKVSEDTYRMEFELQNGETIDYIPGQFITLLVAPNTRRSYSVSTLPSESNTRIATYADINAGGPGSKFFMNTQPGAEVEFIGPLGRFVYQTAEKPAYFFATGTGVVPFMSMIRHALKVEQTKRPIYLFSGFRHRGSIIGVDMFEELKHEFENFHYTLTVSQPDEEWQGLRGRITQYYQEQITQADKDIDAYICGSASMISDVQTKLIEMGVPAKQIYFEQFY